MKTRPRRIAIAGALAVFAAALYSPSDAVRAQSPGLIITPSNGENAFQIAQTLAGPGVQINNVHYTGDSTALGTFTGGSHILGDSFESGIVISSGKVADAVGPNDSDETSTAFDTPGDPDLDALIVDPQDSLAVTFDAAALEFDVTPTQSQVQFKYVFASEEYNEFANSRYNNVFAFFVTQPGFGDQLPRKVNCAVLPDGTPASINNINGGLTGSANDPEAHHPQFFRNNDLTSFPNGAPINIEGDGLTTELTCTATVTPNLPNHFKLVIADSGDSVLDTWVFVKAQTLSGSQTDTPDTEPDDRLSARNIVQRFEPGVPDQTQQFTFDNLGLNESIALQITLHETLLPFTLNATATLHNQDELSRSIVNPAEFPPNTVCKTEGSVTGPVCVSINVVDAATGEFPDPSLYNGPIRWEISIDKASLKNNVAYGMAHFEGNSTSLPDNVILSLDAGVGETDNFSGIVLTESPLSSGPIVLVPADITVPATGRNPNAAEVPYEVKAKGVVIPQQAGFYPIYTDLSPGRILCSPSSHSFPRGTTTVMCTATGDNNVSNTGSFDVTVVDNAPPVLTLPNITKAQTGVLTPVTYNNATAIDVVDGPTPLNCTPPSGSGFPVGTTSVSCESHDNNIPSNSATGTFTVTITGDTVPPVLTLPSAITVPAKNANGAPVTFTATAIDAVDGPVAVTCTPASGSIFPIGATQVQCKAKDSRNNQATGQFQVTVGCCDVKITAGPANVNRGQNITLNISATNFSKKFIYGIVVFDFRSPCANGLVGAAPAILLPGAKFSLTAIFPVPRSTCPGTYTFSTTGIFVDGSTTSYSTSVTVH